MWDREKFFGVYGWAVVFLLRLFHDRSCLVAFYEKTGSMMIQCHLLSSVYWCGVVGSRRCDAGIFEVEINAYR